MGNSSSQTSSTGSSTSLKNQNSSSTIHSMDSSKTNKQSKKWKIPKKLSSKKGSNGSGIDLSLTQPEVSDTDSQIRSWNCHHKLGDIRKNVSLLQSHVINQKQSRNIINETPLMTEQESFTFLWSELGNIANDITKTIHGVTHNSLDRLPNELALLDYWTKIASKYKEYAVIVFEINDIDKIRENLGWESADQIIVKTGKKIQEYCDWYQNDYDREFKLFHSDFKVDQFIVVCHCGDSRVIEDLCDCTMVDVARSVKCFFQETIMWAGYVSKTKNKKRKTHKKYSRMKLIGRDDNEKDDELEALDRRSQFRVLYQRANMALKEAMEKCKYSHKTSDRVMKWMPRQDRMEKGHTVMRVLHEFYVDSCSAGGNRFGGKKKRKSLDEVIEIINRLVKEGADLNYQDSAGNTPFFYSLSLEQPRIIKFLLNKCDFDADHRNKRGETSLTMALKYKLDESICVALAKRIKYPNMPDNSNRTTLVWALEAECFKTMDILASKGAMDYRNWIMSCCMKNQEIVLNEIMQDQDLSFSIVLDDMGRTIMHYAVLHEANRIIEHTLNNKLIHPDIVDKNGWTALHYAVAKDYKTITLLLVEFDADIHLRTTGEHHMTPMDVAVKYKSQTCMAILKKLETEMKQKLKKNNDCNNNSLSELSFRRMSGLSYTDLKEFGSDNAYYTDDDGKDGGDNDDNEDDDDDDDDVCVGDDWNKENEDMNVEHHHRSDNQEETVNRKSESSKNSENAKPPKSKYEQGRFQVIYENSKYKQNKMESSDMGDVSKAVLYSPGSSIGDEIQAQKLSNATRVTCNSDDSSESEIYDQIEQALLMKECNRRHNIMVADDDDDNDEKEDRVKVTVVDDDDWMRHACQKRYKGNLTETVL